MSLQNEIIQLLRGAFSHSNTVISLVEVTDPETYALVHVIFVRQRQYQPDLMDVIDEIISPYLEEICRGNILVTSDFAKI